MLISLILNDVTIEFPVLVESSPEANVEWFVGDELVKDEGRYEIVVEGEEDADKIYTLVIGECTIDDCGTVKCVATNDVGDVSCTAKLNVEREGRISTLLFLICIYVEKELFSFVKFMYLMVLLHFYYSFSIELFNCKCFWICDV